MHFSLVTLTQIVNNAQLLAEAATVLCGVFTVYMLCRFHRFYTAGNRCLLSAVVLLCMFCLEGLLHMSALSGDHAEHIATVACRISVCAGLLILFIVVNHDRLVNTVRGEFTETTSMVKSSRITRLTRTQELKLVEISNCNAMLDTLDLLSSYHTKHLLKTMWLVGWGLVLANMTFLTILFIMGHIN